jgi:hypothetical protein
MSDSSNAAGGQPDNLGGHADPRFTMRVYQQLLDAGPQTVELLEAMLGSTTAAMPCATVLRLCRA